MSRNLILSRNIKSIRKKKGMSQDRLCKLSDVTHTTLAKIESGVNENPTIKTLQKIAKVLGVKIDDLLKA
jgi:transcriptional regulator with XRE-family HTH domain